MAVGLWCFSEDSKNNVQISIINLKSVSYAGGREEETSKVRVEVRTSQLMQKSKKYKNGELSVDIKARQMGTQAEQKNTT